VLGRVEGEAALELGGRVAEEIGHISVGHLVEDNRKAEY
jgi:hypothetical protein